MVMQIFDSQFVILKCLPEWQESCQPQRFSFFDEYIHSNGVELMVKHIITLEEECCYYCLTENWFQKNGIHTCAFNMFL